MNKWLYTKLAWNGIQKNKQLYYPYLIAGIAMVMVFYIFAFLATADVVYKLPNGEVLVILFQYGSWAVGVFSVPFLFYTNSSLIKGRKKELGLYNILGMNKQNIFFILFWEALMTYGIAAFGGIFSGILFSKIAELGIVNIMGKETDYYIHVEWTAVLTTMLVFAGIFSLILLNTLRQIHNNNPIELLHSESTGERPPKGRWFLAAISLILIVLAYHIVAKLEPPMSFQNCFIAAGLITVGTFMLFICASVFLCKILQNNKKYYYKTSHFVTVSTMSFRMKRSGASLAAICVLATLILVTLVFSVGFYSGAVGAIEKHYPYDLGLTVEIPIENMSDEVSTGSYIHNYRSEIESIVQEANLQSFESIETYSANMLALIKGGRLDLSMDMRDTWFEPGVYTTWEKDDEKMIWLRIIPLDVYNQLCKTSIELSEDEVLVAVKTFDYQSDEIVLYNKKEVKVSEKVKQIPRMAEVRLNGEPLGVHGIDEMFLVVQDLYSFMGKEEGSSIYSETNFLAYGWEYGIIMPKVNAGLELIYNTIEEKIQNIAEMTGNPEIKCYLKEEKGEKFYGLAGSFLFLVLILNILFVFVTALIMYYKQISEGYEDQKRFAIMRKIGMTKKEIKQSINSQMLTVFLLPLFVAGIHLLFTVKIDYLLLRYAVVDNKAMVIKVMWISYFLFVIVYSIVYKLTSKTYFKIVNRSANE